MEQYYTVNIKLSIYAHDVDEAVDKLYETLESSKYGADIELMKEGEYKPTKEEPEESCFDEDFARDVFLENWGNIWTEQNCMQKKEKE